MVQLKDIGEEKALKIIQGAQAQLRRQEAEAAEQGKGDSLEAEKEEAATSSEDSSEEMSGEIANGEG